jgi:hypothetical protein
VVFPCLPIFVGLYNSTVEKFISFAGRYVAISAEAVAPLLF